jgi:hypothetical protein
MYTRNCTRTRLCTAVPVFRRSVPQLSVCLLNLPCRGEWIRDVALELTLPRLYAVVCVVPLELMAVDAAQYHSTIVRELVLHNEVMRAACAVCGSAAGWAAHGNRRVTVPTAHVQARLELLTQCPLFHGLPVPLLTQARRP